MNTHEDLPISSATVPADAFGLEPLLDVTELAAYLGVPVSTLYDWRTRGKGPAAYRFGKHLKLSAP
jgi:excisionase family DNA binding protein